MHQLRTGTARLLDMQAITQTIKIFLVKIGNSMSISLVQHQSQLLHSAFMVTAHVAGMMYQEWVGVAACCLELQQTYLSPLPPDHPSSGYHTM